MANISEEDFFKTAPVFPGAAGGPAAPSNTSGPSSSEEDFFRSAPVYGQEQLLPPTAPAPQVPFGEDIKRAAQAGAARGALSLAGLPGDIETLGRLGLRKLGYNVGAESALPTGAQVISGAEKAFPSIQETTQYKPQNQFAKYVKGAAEFLPAAVIPGGQASLGARAAGAIGAGLASQGVEHFTGKPLEEASGYQTAGQLGAALAGGMAGSGLYGKVAGAGKSLLSPSTAASERLGQTMSRDVTAATARGQIPAAIEEGLPPAALAGTQTQRLIREASGRASEATQGAYNQAIQDFRSQAVPKLQSHIDEIVGRGTPVNALAEMDSLASRVRDVNNRNYTRVMALPEAQVIPPAAIASAETRLRTMFGDQFVNDIGRSMIARGESPSSVGLIQTGRDFKIAPTGANLKFWDEAKQYVDDSINKLYDPVTKAPKPGTGSEISTLQALKKSITDPLDKIVTEYPKIRFEGAELYGARNAMDAGYRYFGDKASKSLNSKQNFASNKLTPEQRADFAYGYAGAYRDMLDKNPSAALGLFTGKNAPLEIRKAQFALGNEMANQMIARANAQFLNSKVKELAGAPSSSGYWGAAAAGGVGAEVLATIARGGEFALQNALAFNVSPSMIAGALLASTAKGIYTARERRIAEEIIRQAADPNSWTRLGELMAKNQEARSFMNKLITTSRRTAPVAVTEPQQSAEERPARATGGAVNLRALANSARKAVTKSTEDLLKTPDEHVVKALEVANRHI